MQCYKKRIFFFLSTVGSFFCTKASEQAVFIVPVSDLCIHPRNNAAYKNTSIELLYKAQPLAGEKSCNRAHQCLFNEVVTLIQEKDEQVQIECPNLLYGFDELTQKPMNSFWTLKKNIKTLNDLKSQGIDLEIFPTPLTYGINKKSTPGDGIIVLILPWYDKHTRQWFSPGTRFAHKKECDTKNKMGVQFFNALNNSIISTSIHQKYARKETTPASKDSAGENLVTLLRLWLKNVRGIIPYVWGGSSFIHSYKDEPAVLDPVTSKWLRKEKHYPETGYDCSEMILRAAQICGIPYPYKITSILSTQLKPLAGDEELAPGDLIWYQGHVMVISDLKNNLLIESRGYPTGYGKMHEIPLQALFKNITTYTDLIESYRQKKPLQLLHKDNSLFSTFTEFKLLKLGSIWEK